MGRARARRLSLTRILTRSSQTDPRTDPPHLKRRNATEAKLRSRLQLPLLGSNQDSPDPETPVKVGLNRENVGFRGRIGRPCQSLCRKCRNLPGETVPQTVTAKPHPGSVVAETSLL